MKKSYVYILINHNQKAYKIGTTRNVYKRIKGLSYFWGEFELHDSFVIECPSNYSFKLESLLKNLVHDYKVDFAEDERDKNGWNEFFEIKSLPSLKSFITESLLSFKKDLELLYIKDIMNQKQN